MHWSYQLPHSCTNPESKVHGANMGPTWVLSAPDEPHVGPMNIAIMEDIDMVFVVHMYDCFISRAPYMMSVLHTICVSLTYTKRVMYW